MYHPCRVIIEENIYEFPTLPTIKLIYSKKKIDSQNATSQILEEAIRLPQILGDLMERAYKNGEFFILKNFNTYAANMFFGTPLVYHYFEYREQREYRLCVSELRYRISELERKVEELSRNPIRKFLRRKEIEKYKKELSEIVSNIKKVPACRRLKIYSLAPPLFQTLNKYPIIYIGRVHNTNDQIFVIFSPHKTI